VVGAAEDGWRGRPVGRQVGGWWIDRRLGRGVGPPLVLVHGSVGHHTAFAPLVGELRDEFTIFAMDRRGFGASRDNPGYSAEREFSDVAAVGNAVAARTGELVALFGHSWGASCALGAAQICGRCEPSSSMSPAWACGTRPVRSTGSRSGSRRAITRAP
jgi:pimeloyl-ACP methyl ester carboxylesterase